VHVLAVTVGRVVENGSDFVIGVDDLFIGGNHTFVSSCHVLCEWQFVPEFADCVDGFAEIFAIDDDRG
jgi:hypothetical protein